MQLLDEFSMYALFTRDTEYCVYGFPCSSFRIYSGCLTVFALQSSKLTSGANGVKLGLGLLAFAASITIAYLYLQDPIFHQAASVALVRNHPSADNRTLLPLTPFAHVSGSVGDGTGRQTRAASTQSLHLAP